MSLQDVDWEPVYERQFDSDTSLINDFYRPFLSKIEQYDRLAGYLSLRSLAVGLEGVDSFLQSGGDIRVIAGGDLRHQEKGMYFPDGDDPLSPWIESQLAVIAELLDRGNLQIRVAEPSTGDGLFHPKLGIGYDGDENVVTFEGSINETVSAWKRNYERFKIHRSWRSGEGKYVERDIETFESLWKDSHSSVDVYSLDEAAKRNLIDWKADDEDELADHVERVQEKSPSLPLSEGDLATIASTAGKTPGGIHLAEDVSTVTPWPHQRTIADTATSIYPENLLFCDEVGLGKTIEAGLTLSRLVHTGTVDSGLLLVPAGLVGQWQAELRDKFNVYAYRFEREPDGDYLVGASQSPRDRHKLSGSVGSTPWSETPIGGFIESRDEPTVVIVSWHTARLSQNQGLVSPITGDGEPWGLTIVDEAHSAREGTNLYNLLTRMRDASTCLYALTATPMQLEVSELYDLLRLCDLPDSWDNKEQFAEFFQTRRVFAAALEDVDIGGQNAIYESMAASLEEELERDVDIDEARHRVRTFAQMLHDHIEAYPGYADDVTEAINAVGIRDRTDMKKLLGAQGAIDSFESPAQLMTGLDMDSWQVIADVAEWATPVETRIFRNSRPVLHRSKDLGLLDATVPDRDVETKSIELTGSTEDLYERVEEYISNTYTESQKRLTGKEKLAIGFVMTIYKQRLMSSLSAMQESLKRRKQKLDTELEEMTDELAGLGGDSGVTESDIEGVFGDSERIDAYTNEEVINLERAELREFINDLEHTISDPKIEQLVTDIKRLRHDANDDIIIFTQYHDTLDYIKDTLAESHPNIGTYSGQGGNRYNAEMRTWESVGKEAITTEFKATDGIDILICTDSASEGLNLQTADALINYDLPWNPMRVEQRIGRIDRIGQENEVVTIYNYAYEDGIDDDIYTALGDRHQLFEDVVGEARPILNSIESNIEAAAMGEKGTDEVIDEVESKAKDVAEELESAGLGVDDVPDKKATLISDAGVDGWGDISHPALGPIGFDERPHSKVVSNALIEALFTHSTALNNHDWTFTALRNHPASDTYPDVSDNAYILEPPDDGSGDPTVAVALGEEETAQRVFSAGSRDENNCLLVTFNIDTAETYPSIRLLLPGDPLFNHLLSIIQTHTESDMISLIYGSIESGDSGIQTTKIDSQSGDSQISDSEYACYPITEGSVEKSVLDTQISTKDIAKTSLISFITRLKQ